MSRTKTCPACQRDIPMLAVRCKHCGFKLSSQPEPEPRPSAPPPPPPMVRISSAPPAPPPMARISNSPPAPPPMVRISAPPPAPPRPGPVVPMARAGVPQPPVQRPSTPPPAVASQKRTMFMSAMAPQQRPVGLGMPGDHGPIESRTTMPPPPVGQPAAAAPRLPNAPAPGATPRVDDSDDWIPLSRDLVDESELITLSTDSSTVQELPATELEPVAPPAVRAAAAEADIVHDDDHADDVEIVGEADDERPEPDFVLFKYLMSDDALDEIETKRWPPLIVKLLGKVRYLHAIAVGVVLLALIATIVILIALPSSKGAGPEAGPVAGAVPNAGAAGATPNAAAAKGPSPAVKVVTAPTGPVPAPGKTCRKWAEYPQLPWREHLEAASKAVGADGPCGLFGASASQVAGALEALPRVGPSGYDLIPGGELLEVFPTGKAERRGPSIELLFVGGKLFEIRLSYRETISLDVSAGDFGDLLGTKPEKTKDFLDRKVQRLADNDVAIEFVEEEWYGRKLKTVVLASVAMRGALESGRANREAAEKDLVAGDAALAKWDVNGALARFQAASDKVPTYGYAYARQGLALTRLEKFDEVEKVARKALEASGENRARAEAFGLLAVAALFRGDVAKAIASFESAAAADPANAFFTMSANELKTGAYTVDRVARTAARMECRGDKGLKATEQGLLARGNFPSLEKYFEAIRKASSDPAFAKAKKEFAKRECP
jgi:tetratricopeptide (TPR) repeat protein